MSQNARRVPIASLGEGRYESPLSRKRTTAYVRDNRSIRHAVQLADDTPLDEELLFEKSGPREKLFFDPAKTRAAIVTCGGLSPGLNNVIRSAFLELHMNYGVPEVLGIRYGYEGLIPSVGVVPLQLTMEKVESIHEHGGTILGSSRGAQDPAVIVDFLQARQIQVLLCVGGDGTQRGAHCLVGEIERRRLPIAVVGIPKTIDNDIEYCTRTFGFTTAVAAAQQVIACAHVEAKGARDGIGLIKLMGRDAGFIAAAATVASQEVNFTLVPEFPLRLRGERGFLEALRRRMLDRHHAVIVVSEGAGQDLFAEGQTSCDASGNVRYQDIGLYLKSEINAYFAERGPKVELKYIDPSYVVRSVAANAEDDMLCDQFARRAVHAGMAGKTDMMIGHVSGQFVHVPLEMATARKRRVAPEGELWTAVLSTTGQPERWE